MIKENLLKLIERYNHLGVECVSVTGATLIGRAPYIGSEAWLNSMYSTLSECDVVAMEKSMERKIPIQYREFLLNCSNDLNIMNTTLCLFGCRKLAGRDITASRQPFDLVTLNTYTSERTKNASPDLFFFGGYDWDGSQVYLAEDNKVHFCSPNDCTSLKSWNSLDEQ